MILEYQLVGMPKMFPVLNFGTDNRAYIGYETVSIKRRK